MTKLVLCSEPHACAQTAVRQWDDRQMRMTDKDTPHAQKIMLTSIGPQQWTGNTLIKDCYRWPHRPRPRENNPRRVAGRVRQFSLAPLVDVVADCVCVFHCTLSHGQLLIFTIDRTPSRNSRNIVTLFPCLFVKASTTIRSCGTHLHLALSVCILLLITHNSCAVRLP